MILFVCRCDIGRAPECHFCREQQQRRYDSGVDAQKVFGLVHDASTIFILDSGECTRVLENQPSHFDLALHASSILITGNEGIALQS